VPQGVRLVRLAQRVPIETGVAFARDSRDPLVRHFAALAGNSE
jgi:hypothetical protein